MCHSLQGSGMRRDNMIATRSMKTNHSIHDARDKKPNPTCIITLACQYRQNTRQPRDTPVQHAGTRINIWLQQTRSKCERVDRNYFERGPEVRNSVR